MKNLITLLLSGFFILNLSAQMADNQTGFIDEEIREIDEQIARFKSDYDYGQEVSSIYDTLLLNIYNFDADEVPQYSPTIIQERLAAIPSIIRLDYNDYVQRYIDLYTVGRREQVSRMLGLKEVYFTTFEQELDKAGLPMELKYMPVVESALNPHARSPKGATGLWQFMLGTAKMYGLKVNSYVDERKDPNKATLAAIRYLKDQYEEFGDWLLVIAAYNCGPGNVRKAIIRSGGMKDFWSIREYLPAETRGYVPAFISAVYTFSYAAEHNIYPVYVDFSLEMDTLHIKRLSFSLDEIAELTGSDAQLLRNLNPELQLGKVPYSLEPYVLRVPHKVSAYFTYYPETIRTRFGPGSMTSYEAPKEAATYAPKKYTYDSNGKDYITHTVGRGEVVSQIAQKYGVSSRDVAKWNNLRGYRIKAGQKLRIYKASGSSQTSRSASSNGETVDNVIPRYHYVRKGDTFWAISKRYGIQVERLKSLNSHVDPGNLKLGQRIVLK